MDFVVYNHGGRRDNNSKACKNKKNGFLLKINVL